MGCLWVKRDLIPHCEPTDNAHFLSSLARLGQQQQGLGRTVESEPAKRNRHPHHTPTPYPAAPDCDSLSSSCSQLASAERGEDSRHSVARWLPSEGVPSQRGNWGWRLPVGAWFHGMLCTWRDQCEVENSSHSS